MKYSVIIPLFNKEPYVAATLQSVVDQVRWPDEVIVIDDGSTDHSLEAASEFLASADTAFLRTVRVEVLRLETNSGIGRARNVGFDRSTGDVVTFLDADDVYHPEFFLKMAELFEMHGADLVTLRVQLFPSGIAYPDFNALRRYFHPISENAYLITDPMAVITSHRYVIGVGSNVVVRRKWMEAERFDESGRFYEGVDCWYRHFRRLVLTPGTRILQLQGNYLNVREVLGSASRKRFSGWHEIALPVLIERYRESHLEHDYLMSGLLRGRWTVHAFTNLLDTRQKLLFVFHFRSELWKQIPYGLRKLSKMLWK